MILDDVAADRQTQAGTLGVTVGRRAGPVEFLRSSGDI
jgi:hypothetical protein